MITESVRSTLATDLAGILKSRYYSFRIQQQNTDDRFRAEMRQRRELLKNAQASLKWQEQDANSLARTIVDRAVGGQDAPKLLHPVRALELVPRDKPLVLYRAYDGISNRTAGTLGAWWSTPDVIGGLASRFPKPIPQQRHAEFIQQYLAANFVHPAWNGGLDVARMEIPVGCRLPVIVGDGDWQAMKSPQSKDPYNPNKTYPPISSARDLKEHYGIDAATGVKQIYAVFLNDMWIAKVPHLSKNWPFA